MLRHKTSDLSTVLHLCQPAMNTNQILLSVREAAVQIPSVSHLSLRKQTNPQSRTKKLHDCKNNEVQNDHYIQDYKEIFKMPALL